MKFKKILKIAIPILILLVIGFIWFMKNSVDSNAVSTNENLEITSVDLEEYKLQNLPIVIDFGSDSCIPCKEMYPVLVTMNEEMQGKAIIHFVDVWKYTDAAEGYPVQVIPTQMFITAEGSPYVPSEDVENSIDFIKYVSKESEEHIFTVHEGGLTEFEMRLILADMGAE